MGDRDYRVDARWLPVGDVLRYPNKPRPRDITIDGYPNYHFVTRPPDRPDFVHMQLESGINRVAYVEAHDGDRRPVINLRSSPWKAGGDTNPWHDEFDLDHGHIRYFGDHKVDTLGPVGVTAGNKALLEAWPLHAASRREDRLKAPPLLVYRADRKGYVEFCGAAIIERLEHVVQRDPRTGRSFPNIVLDLVVIDLSDSGDRLDFRWIDDRRDAEVSASDALRFAPASWVQWTREGRSALPRVRRRVLASRVLSSEDQQPEPGSPDEQVLTEIYSFFHGRKHAFELLASRVAADVLRESGGRYVDGWLTRSSGDGGVDFVGRLDMGSPGASTPIVVLGQAKCVSPSSSVSAEQVARVVARLRRGWVGVYVTTGVFSRMAQVEIIDDQYPVVLVHGRMLAQRIRRICAEDFNGDLSLLLSQWTSDYESAVTMRRPEEVLQA